MNINLNLNLYSLGIQFYLNQARLVVSIIDMLL
jgi:hypothetical protein